MSTMSTSICRFFSGAKSADIGQDDRVVREAETAAPLIAAVRRIEAREVDAERLVDDVVEPEVAHLVDHPAARRHHQIEAPQQTGADRPAPQGAPAAPSQRCASAIMFEWQKVTTALPHSAAASRADHARQNGSPASITSGSSAASRRAWRCRRSGKR